MDRASAAINSKLVSTTSAWMSETTDLVQFPDVCAVYRPCHSAVSVGMSNSGFQNTYSGFLN